MIELRLLRQPSIRLHGAQALELTPKDAALLAVLAIDGASTRVRLAAWLWPHTPRPQALANLRQRLLRLRRLLGQDVITGTSTIALAPGVDWELANAIKLLRADPHALTGDLLGALEFPRCEELEHWLYRAREQWRARCLSALASVALELEQANAPAAALPYVQRLVSEDPLHEHYHSTLINLHLQLGNQAAALASYERLKDVLSRELGVAPSAAITHLANSIRNQVAAAASHRSTSRKSVLVLGDPARETPGLGAANRPVPNAFVVRARSDQHDQPYALLSLLALAAKSQLPNEEKALHLARLVEAKQQAGEQPDTRSNLGALRAALHHLIDVIQPAPLVIENLQYADSASLHLLTSVIRTEP